VSDAITNAFAASMMGEITSARSLTRATAWPLDSWSVTEPDDGYQARYIRLLAKFAQ
jgi:hypothetical protein